MNWIAFNTGLTPPNVQPYGSDVQALAVDGTYLYAGTRGTSVWRRPLSDIVTSVESFSSEPPSTFSLEQNYPNPFNPTTTVEFDLPHSEFVTLTIYNILGEEVTTLVSERLTAGKYKYDWDAGSLASGIYLYRIEAGDYVEVKKMVLIK